KEARREFRDRTAKLGVIGRAKRLEDDLGALGQTPFSVVNLDFTGQLCETNLHIVDALQLTRHACVGINLWGKRESVPMQAELRHAFALVGAVMDSAGNSSPFDLIYDYSVQAGSLGEARSAVAPEILGASLRRSHPPQDTQLGRAWGQMKGD